MPQLQVDCQSCDYREIWSESDVLERLSGVGMLRRVESVDDEFLTELLRHVAAKMVCPECGTEGPRLGPVEARDQDEWEPTRACSECGGPIPPERLELLPETTRCVNCQNAEESGASTAEADYCPRCGGILSTRTASRGTTKYVQYCNDCRWQG